MAAESKKPVQSESKGKFYRSQVAGLKVLTGDRNEKGKNDPDMLDFVQFSPRQIRWEGDLVKVGVLETEDAYVQKVLATDPNVSEISEKEYKDLLGNG